MNMELLVQEIARCVLQHGYLHLGECTLFEFIGNDLDVSDETLVRVEHYLDKVLGDTK